jgi:ribonuclease VapC
VRLVIDSSALLALVKDEPGARIVADALPSAVTSAVIFAESISKAANQGYDPDRVAEQLRADGLSIHPATSESLSSVIKLHRLAARSVSLADRFCLALAMDLGAPVLTADHPWRELGLPVELRFIR